MCVVLLNGKAKASILNRQQPCVFHPIPLSPCHSLQLPVPFSIFEPLFPMSIDFSSDSTVEMVVQDPNFHPISPSHQNGRVRSSQQRSSAIFKGVVRLKGGTWGARISYKYKQYWLGAYEKEIEAAMAYDRAAVKFQRVYSLNFHRSNYSIEESAFQSHCSTEEILSMLQDKTYLSMLMNFISNYSSSVGAHTETFMKEKGISY